MKIIPFEKISIRRIKFFLPGDFPVDSYLPVMVKIIQKFIFKLKQIKIEMKKMKSNFLCFLDNSFVGGLLHGVRRIWCSGGSGSGQ